MKEKRPARIPAASRESPQPQHCLPGTQSTARQPHTTVSARATTVRGLSQLRTGWSGAPAITPDETVQGKTPEARAAAFAALLGNATLAFEGPLSQNQTVTYHF